MNAVVSRRVVLYSSLDGEPITVVELPSVVLDALKRRGVARLAVVEAPQFMATSSPLIDQFTQPKNVDVWVEYYERHGQRFPMIFTADEESALLLRAAFLPGQNSTVDELRARAYALGFLKALLMS